MKKTGNLNINTRTYWNQSYENDVKRAEYQTPSNRFKYALKYVDKGTRVLDIGCGVGMFTTLVKGQYPNCEVWGVDISSAVIDANKKEHDPDIHYIQQYVGSLNKVPSNYFNLVFSGETLEHLDEPADLFKDANRILVEGGRFVITTPLNNGIRSEEHVWFFDKNDVKKLYLDNGFAEPEFVTLPGEEGILVIFAVGVKL